MYANVCKCMQIYANICKCTHLDKLSVFNSINTKTENVKYIFCREGSNIVFASQYFRRDIQRCLKFNSIPTQ